MAFPFICMYGTIPAYVNRTVVQTLFVLLYTLCAPISHLRPVRWGLFSILKISAVFEQEASYDD